MGEDGAISYVLSVSRFVLPPALTAQLYLSDRHLMYSGLPTEDNSFVWGS